MGRKATRKTVKPPTPSPEPVEDEVDNVVQLRRSPRKKVKKSKVVAKLSERSNIQSEAIRSSDHDSSGEAGVAPPHALDTQKRKSKKDAIRFDRAQEDTILDFMEGNECLWNPGHGEWMKGDIKEKVWRQIGDILQCDPSDVRTWWNTNKDRYVREHKKSKSGSGSKLLSARMQWLMTRLSFYSKVVTHHQQPIVSIRSSIAQREGRDPSPVSDDNPDEITTRRRPGPSSNTVEKVVSQIEEHLKAAEQQQRDLLKPKTEQEAYGLYVNTWLSGLGGVAFDNARTVINDLISVTSRKARSRFTPPVAPATTQPFSPISDVDQASPNPWQQDQPQPLSSMAASQGTTSQDWQPDPSTWRPYSDLSTPLYKSQVREYMGLYHQGKKNF
jgi:hypothetical protein